MEAIAEFKGAVEGDGAGIAEVGILRGGVVLLCHKLTIG